MSVKLKMLNSKQAGATYLVCKGVYFIGRHKDADLRINSPQVSLEHCEVLLHEGTVWVRDLQSTNGTRVNGEPVHSERQLEAGDKLWIGPALLELIIVADKVDGLGADGGSVFGSTMLYGMGEGREPAAAEPPPRRKPKT